jgi:hypothetical protein
MLKKRRIAGIRASKFKKASIGTTLIQSTMDIAAIISRISAKMSVIWFGQDHPGR